MISYVGLRLDAWAFATYYATMTGATSPGKVHDVRLCSLGSPGHIGYDKFNQRVREASKVWFRANV